MLLVDADPQGQVALGLGFPKKVRVTLKNMLENIIMGLEFDPKEVILKHKETADFIEQLARRARKRGVRLVLASQNTEEFTSTSQGRATLNSCGTAIIMKQSPMSVDKVIEFFKLSKGTRDFLLQARKGEAILYMEGKVSAITIEVLEKEKEMIKV